MSSETMPFCAMIGQEASRGHVFQSLWTLRFDDYGLYDYGWTRSGIHTGDWAEYTVPWREKTN